MIENLFCSVPVTRGRLQKAFSTIPRFVPLMEAFKERYERECRQSDVVPAVTVLRLIEKVRAVPCTRILLWPLNNFENAKK